MKKDRIFWNYVDMFIQTTIIFVVLISVYFIMENLEKYFYRYTVFPFCAFVIIFVWGYSLGKSIEKTKHKKPIGLISKKMYEARKKKSVFIFSNDGETYTPHKEIIDEIKSGEIVHVKQFAENDFNIENFDDIYTISMDDIVDMNMKNDEENKK